MSTTTIANLNLQQKQAAEQEYDTLYACLQNAKSSNESVFTGVLCHCWRNLHPDRDGLDRWHLTLVLATLLAYLYIRQPAYVTVGFLFAYVVSYAAFFCLKRCTHDTSASIVHTHTQDRELLTDPLLFTASLFTAWYVVDYSAFGFGVGQSIHTITHHAPSPVHVALILGSVLLFTGHLRFFWYSLLIVLVSIWPVHIFTTITSHRDEYARWLEVRAVLLTLFFYAAFFVPIQRHFLKNAIVALLAALFFASTIHFVVLHHEVGEMK